MLFLCVFVFLKGRAGADGGRGEIGEVGAKVQQKKKSVKIIAVLFTQQLFPLFSSHASSFARFFPC